MMKTQFVVRARLVCSAVCLASVLAGCGGGGKGKDGGIVSGRGGGSGGGSGGEGGGTIPFDAQNAPYGDNTTTARTQSVITVTSDLLGNKIRSLDTAVVGPKLIGGIIYDRLVTSRTDEPTRGAESWIKQNADGTVDLAGFMHTDLLSGVLPGASTTFDTPIKVNLNSPLGVQQPVTATGTVALEGAAAPSPATFTGQYALVEKNTTVPTGVGPVSGCSHFSGSATTTSPAIPALLQGMAAAAELWYHPSFGIVAFNAPTLGVGTAMTGSYDCGSVDASGYRIIRKVGVVDATTSFNLDSFECDGKALAADKNTHAKMLLELRWADEAAAKTSVQPVPGLVEFGTGWGYFLHTINQLPASVFHPEENGKGFQYWHAYVDQAAKNEPGTSTSYHIKVGSAPGLSPVRVTARIYYKTIPSLVGPGPDAAALGSGNKDGGRDAGLVDGSRDAAGATGDGGDGTIADLPSDPAGTGDTRVASGDADGGVPPTCGVGTPCPTVIHSTTSGGTWSDTATWVEKVVPTAATDVEISGPVVIAAEAPCNNLTIKSGGMLQNVGRGDPYGPTPTTINGNLTIEAGGMLTNEPGYRSRVVVMGNCTNGGTIKNGAAGVLLEVKRSFTQNGTYEGPSITFNGGSDQTISCGVGKKMVGSIVVSNPAKSIKATSDMYFENVTVAMSDTTSQGTIDMNGFKLFVSGGATALITDDTSNHAPRIKYTNIAGINCADGAMIYESSFANSSAPITIDGVLTTAGRAAGGTQVTFDGDLTVNAGATMQNELGYHSGIVVTGSLVNNGTINGRSGGYGVEVRKNLTQNNVYTATETIFGGTGVDTVSMGAGKKIMGSIVVSSAAKSIKATSNLYFENVTVAMSDTTSQGTIDMSGFKLFVSGGATALVTDDTSNHVPRIKYTNIAGISCADGAMIYESSFANSSAPITIDGVLTTCGRGAGGTQATFDGDLTVNAGATMQNELGYHSGVVVTGSLVNNGTVNERAGGYGFEIKKNLTQNNVYTASGTTFSGTGVQTISMALGKKIAGTIVLANAKSGGTLKALSDLTVENVTFTVGDATTTTAVDMNQNKLILVGGYRALLCDDDSNHVPRVTFANIAGITGASPDPATDPMMWESSFENLSAAITLAGQFRTAGRSAGGTQIRFTGNVVLSAGAVWRNEAGYRSGITISGSFTNNGTAGGSNLLVINDTAY